MRDDMCDGVFEFHPTQHALLLRFCYMPHRILPHQLLSRLPSEPPGSFFMNRVIPLCNRAISSAPPSITSRNCAVSLYVLRDPEPSYSSLI